MPFCLEPARVKRRTHRQITVLRTDRIRPGAWNTAPAGDVSALMRSIKRIGLLCPILVRPACGGAYELIAGRRRLAACRALGMEELECIVMPALDEECLIAALGENACRTLPPPDEAERMRRELTGRHGYASDDVIALCGADEPPAAAPAPQADPPRRICCIRDERLVVNAVADMVRQLQQSGVEARMQVDEQSGNVNMAVNIPRIPARRSAEPPAAITAEAAQPSRPEPPTADGPARRTASAGAALTDAPPDAPEEYIPRRSAAPMRRAAPASEPTAPEPTPTAPGESPAAMPAAPSVRNAGELLEQLFAEERDLIRRRKIDAGGLTLAL